MKFYYLLYKDTLLMLKDRAGVFLMFLMPLVLVLVMTLLQDNTFKAVLETNVDLLILNQDQGAFGALIEKELVKKNIFNLTRNISQEPLTTERLKQKVSEGKYKIGLVIPKNATAKIKAAISRSAQIAFENGPGQAQSPPDQVEILIFIDPTTRQSYRVSMMSSIRELAAEIKKDFIINEIFKVIGKMFDLPLIKFPTDQKIIVFKQAYAVDGKSAIMPNSVQHNVPAWTLFAMFFIVISLAGNMINERRQGSYLRLLTMPVPLVLILFSKVTVYFTICLLQFILMLLMGIYVLPWFDLPALTIGTNLPAIALIAAASALAAVGYSILVGVVATTYHQVSSFGAISIVILSALGGIWVPVFAMPKFMQVVSNISPLNWGIEGFYEVFIRNGNLSSVLPNAAALLVFAALCMIGAVFYNSFRLRQN